ncbi:hypothetical protein RND81_02G214800 [Saponaria officinalis]|uniref:F-box domain-containing protein n=1 Tax=Saponaria officinalis TaxID=3572 RepID=A0AAW1MYN6_SAPOF
MVSTKNKTSRVELPNELIENILSRLPSKYLLRFRCVCKSWNFLTAHDSSFRNLHLCNSNFLNDSNDGSIWLQYTSTPNKYYRSYGEFSDDGWEDNYFLCLWNPSIRKYHWVDLEFINYKFKFVNKYSILWIGYGLAIKSKDYKIVLVCQESSTQVNHVFVYSLKTMQWTKIDTNLKPDTITPSRKGATYVNGACHWIRKCRVIYSFNLDTHCFRYIKLPSKSKSRSTMSLSMWNDKLSVSENFWSGLRRCVLNIWVMKDDDDTSSDYWTLFKSLSIQEDEPLSCDYSTLKSLITKGDYGTRKPSFTTLLFPI